MGILTHIAKRLRRIRVRSALLTIGLLYIPLHMFGYRVWGEPKVVNNYPLSAPVEIIELTKDGQVILGDGRCLQVYGVESFPCADDGRALEMLRKRSRNGRDVKCEVHDQNGSVKILVEYRNSFGCGNTFWPSFFPRRLPMYGAYDLARSMVVQGWVHAAIDMSFPRDPILSELSLMEFEAQVEGRGCWASAEVLRECVYEKFFYMDLPQQSRYGTTAWDQRTFGMARILLRLNYPGTSELLMTHVRDERLPAQIRTQLANELARCNDLSGLDVIMEWLTRPFTPTPHSLSQPEEERNRAMSELSYIFANSFGGYGDDLAGACRRIAEWFQACRATLKWDDAMRRLRCG